MSNKFYLLKSEDRIVLGTKGEDESFVIIADSINDIKNNINMIVDFTDCFIKYYEEKETLVLRDNKSNACIVIKNSNQLLEDIEFKEIATKIIRAAQTNQCVLVKKRTKKYKVNRKSKYSNKVIKRLILIVASVTIVYSATSHLLRRNNDLDDTVNVINNESSFSDSFDEYDLSSISDEDILNEFTLEEIYDDTIDISNVLVVNDSESNGDNELMSFELLKQQTFEDYNEPQIDIDKAYLEFEDLSDSEKAVTAKENYFDIMEKYAKKYGLDPYLVLSIATQERGVHASKIDAGGGVGLMQIQYAVWKGKPIDYYELNLETNSYERHSISEITDDMLMNVDSNIQLGCLILQECLRNSNYNIPLAIQMYNMGYGSIYNMVEKYATDNGMTRADVFNNPYDLGWMNYRDNYPGDPHYLENVNKWADYNKFTVINVFNNEEVTMEFSNDNELSRHAR